MDNLTKLQSEVKTLLEADKNLRNSDNLLYTKLLSKMDSEVLTLPVSTFYQYFSDYDVPRFESVARARRKVQELYPELKADEPVRSWRRENESAFKNYAKEK